MFTSRPSTPAASPKRPEGDGAPLAKGVIRAQAETALAEASVAVLVVDAREGVLPDDQLLADVVRRSGKPVLVAANKMDDGRTVEKADLASVYALGFPEVFSVSAAHGRDISSLLDAVVAALPESEAVEPEADDGIPRVAVVGRPNAGKSTLLNRLLGEERFVVSEVPGTTRDALEVELRRGERVYRLIDTAGVRRKIGHGDDLERESAALSERALERCDVAVILFDATEPAVEQDSRLIGKALELGRPLIIAPNKVDLLSGPAEACGKRLKDAIPTSTCASSSRRRPSWRSRRRAARGCPSCSEKGLDRACSRRASAASPRRR